MRTFKGFPEDKKCPVCGGNEDRERVLVPIVGTEDGNICEAIAVHLDCAVESLQYDSEVGLLFAIGV